ncbi:MAG: 2Fe-2S iron-sulfur cluster-binding protein [Phreatobacter sp.]|uniref:2Fe-2S iron-sulfur cluster-binding protein n=1 Tax=Phreatobacter sp. TaxID=1966341 RepID=UPI002733AD0C|nr:2Fe-2S iron-sulfur cluster-binding protein [Phreatobacter sp.]MDP2801854.1 2Fe-2S iron-sulfur cluster-binding protein [Phreatobacter sp.]
MTKVTFVGTDGSETVLDVPPGTSFMQVAVSAGLAGIVAECGGAAMCATCHVYIDPADSDKLAPISTIENEMLAATASERRANSRLSCQLQGHPDLSSIRVHLPETQV